MYDLNILLGVKPKENIMHEVVLVPPSPEINNTSIKDEELKKMLLKYGEFPEKHRVTIWKNLLKIPLNLVYFDDLLKKGEHPSIEFVQKQFPLKDQQLMQKFSKVFSALAFWCPILAEADFFPAIVFPFVKLCDNNLISSFEMIMSVVLNWLNAWFENFPNPPIKYLIQIEDIIKTEEPKLIKHLSDLGISSSTYIWPIIKYLFTQVMTKTQFCILMDHVFVNYTRPEFLICLSSAYIIYYKSTLLALQNPHDFQGFLLQQNPLNVIKLVKIALKLLEKSTQMECRIPIPNEYPIFTNYPDFALRIQVNIRERYVKQDQEIQMKKKYIEDINKKFLTLEEEEFKNRREQEALIQAENERRKMNMLEESYRLKEKQQVDQETRRIRLAQIHRIENTIEQSLKSQESLRRKELSSLEEEMNAAAEAEKYYSQSKKEEDHLSLLEFKAAQRLLELMRVKNAEESMRKLRLNARSWEIEQEQRERLLKNQWDIENEQRRIDLEMMKENKLKELEMCTEYNNKRRMDAQQHLKTLERELKIMDLEKERQLRLIAEEELLRNEEYLAQLKIKQELIRENDERQFQIALNQEKEYKFRKNEEILIQIRQEQEKQAIELRRQREENERLEKELEQNAVDDKIREMRQESDLIAREKEKMTQEMLLKIEEERNNQRRIQQDIEYRRREIKERAAHQRVVKDNIDGAIQQERENFIKFKEEINQESTKLEYERKKMHEKKMNEILQQREDALLQITQPNRKPDIELKNRLQEFRNFSEEEVEPKYSHYIRTENSPQHDAFSSNREELRFENHKRINKYQDDDEEEESEQRESIDEEEIFGNSRGKNNQKSDNFGDTHKRSKTEQRNGEKVNNFSIKEQFEESYSSSGQIPQNKKLEFKIDDKTKKQVSGDEPNAFVFMKNPKRTDFEENYINKIDQPINKDMKTEKVLQQRFIKEVDEEEEKYSLKSSEKASCSSPDYENAEVPQGKYEKTGKDYIEKFEFEKYKGPKNDIKEPRIAESLDTYEFRTHPVYDQPDPNELNYRNKTPKDEMFDLKKITQFNKEYQYKSNLKKDYKPESNKSNEKYDKEEGSYYTNSELNEESEEKSRKKWRNDSYSKYSEPSAESSSLSYHRIDPPKEERFYINKTQKPDIDYSARWEEKSEGYSSYNSHDCSSCEYSNSKTSSECSCDCSSEESSPKVVSPRRYNYSSSDYSEDSYVHHSTQL